jgi:predicted metal-dependent phosphoesterase TrpH
MDVDLHVHTTASDGLLTPHEAVREASLTGLRAVAITDHDSVEGIRPALRAGRTFAIEVIPGIEINTDYRGKGVHILGYLLDYQSSALEEKLMYLRNARYLRASQMVQKLQSLGLSIDMDDVMQLVGFSLVSRPHIAQALYKKGYVRTPTDAFRQYIGRGRPAFVPRYKMTPMEAVRVIREAKGIPVFAHPGTAGADHLIPDMISEGLLGLEVFHPEHNDDKRAHYLDLAEYYGLIYTGGSDSHGPMYKSNVLIGDVHVPYQVVLNLKRLKEEIEIDPDFRIERRER